MYYFTYQNKGFMIKKLILIAILTLGFAQATDNHTNYANKQAQTRVFKTPQEVHMKYHSMIKNHPNKKVVAHKNSRYYADSTATVVDITILQDILTDMEDMICILKEDINIQKEAGFIHTDMARLIL